ncbi:MAG: hypothetical protein ACYC2X_03645 [Coriobacteriia bacterium]
MARELTTPSPELAERLLREVGQAERLTGLKMSVMGGSNPIALYSLAQVASFLKIGTYEQAKRANNQETIGYIDLKALQTWVREVLMDEELADAIADEMASGEPFGIVAPRVREVLMTRAVQVAPFRDPDEGAAEAADSVAEGDAVVDSE